MENKFCFLKGLVECDSGVIQNCNNMRTQECPLEKMNTQTEKENKEEKPKEQHFCFLKGLVDCSEGRVQECNNQHVNKCIKEK